MKKKLMDYLIFAVIFFSGINWAMAIPKYTDKETALSLAKVLDKGSYGRYTIASTYVQNDTAKDYYISVILSDGSSHKWFINQIYKWSRDDKLQLAGNRNLLFLDSRDSRFVVLNKNRFHRLALKANVFVKVFQGDDPLAGKTFLFQIKSFNLISPTESAFGRNITGSKYRYIMDFNNGMRELLTYEDAYTLMKKDRLRVEERIDKNVFGRAYHITKIIPHTKGEIVNGVSQFGIEVHFDQPIELEGSQLPFEIYERRARGSKPQRKGKSKNQKEYVLDITIPNSEKKFEVKSLKSLEYLHDIEVVKSPKFPKRMLLRSLFNPEVMDIPPVVYKNGDNSIYVNFFNMMDQTVLNREMLLETEKRKAAEQRSVKEIKVTKTIKTDSDYGRAYVVAVETYKQSQAIRDSLTRIEKLLESIRQFEEAALLAGVDAQLYNALMKRNQLRSEVILLSLEYIKINLAKEDLGGTTARNLMKLLNQAESFTRKQDLLTEIDALREKIIARQE